MKLTFEEYLDSYKNEPDWMPRPTLEEYEKIQEECLLAEFLGYREYPNTVLHRWDEQGEVWYEQMFEYGLYLTYDPKLSNRKVFEGNDELLIGEMNWKSWDNLMFIVDKIRSYPIQLAPEKGSISLLTFAISRTGIFMEYYKRISDGCAEYGKSYHQHVEGDPDASDCESYMETIYNACVDFVKFVNE